MDWQPTPPERAIIKDFFSSPILPRRSALPAKVGLAHAWR